jgi:hypothetical protein
VRALNSHLPPPKRTQASCCQNRFPPISLVACPGRPHIFSCPQLLAPVSTRTIADLFSRAYLLVGSVIATAWLAFSSSQAKRDPRISFPSCDFPAASQVCEPEEFFVPVSAGSGNSNNFSLVFVASQSTGIILEPLDPWISFSNFLLCFHDGFLVMCIRCLMKCA